MGLEVFLSLVIGVGGGLWLDARFHSSPWLTLVGAFGAVGAAVKALMRVARTYKKLLREEDQASPSDHDPPPPHRD